MVLVSTITIEGTPGSTIAVTEVRDEGGRITLVVRGAHVALADIIVEHGKETEKVDKAVGTQNCGIQGASAGDDQAAETQQEKKKEGEEEEGEVIEAVNTSSPPSSLSSPSSVPVSLREAFQYVQGRFWDAFHGRGACAGRKDERRGILCRDGRFHDAQGRFVSIGDNERYNASLPSPSSSSSTSSSTTLSLEQDNDEPGYRLLAYMLDDLHNRGSATEGQGEKGRKGKREG